jgi:PAS domain S-box-containing protein
MPPSPPKNDGEAAASDVPAVPGQESVIYRFERVLRTISAFNQMLVRAESESELLREGCRLIVESGGYRLAWVGFAEADESRMVRPVAVAGFEEGYLQTAKVTWSDGPRGRGPTGTSIRTGRPAICQDMLRDPTFEPWREEAIRRGYASLIALPLKYRERVLGAVTIYSAESAAFDEEEVKLLRELVDDIAYGIIALRTSDEHRKAMADLRQNEERFRLMVESSPNGLCTVDPRGIIVLVNTRMEELFGYPAAEMLGQSVDRLVPESARSGHAVLRDAFRSGPSGRPMGDRPSYPARRRDGSEFPVEISLHPIQMPEGPMTLATITDITDRVRAEHALRDREALFNSLISTIPDKLYFKDRQSRFVQINESMAKYFGLKSASEAVGKSDFDIFSEKHARQAFEDEQRIMATGEPLIGVEESETWPDGRVTWVSTTKVPLRDAEGRINGLVGISRDITERKTLEAQYLQSQKMEAFGQLAGGVAHDFNNILAAMFMHVNLIQQTTGPSSPVTPELRELEQLTARAAGLTRQLLMFSRRQEMETRPLDLNAVLEGTCKMLRRLIGEDVVFELKLSPAPLMIEADAGMLEQMVMNLCINSRDAMPKGGRLTIETGARAFAPSTAHPGHHACLVVTDTGCGMDSATKARIFEPFFTTKPVGKGTGLGLATAYGILQQHKGWVEVDSTQGVGTTFRIHFPLKEQAGPAKSAGFPGAIQGGTESILLVEDEDSVRAVFAKCLQRAGYRVEVASNGVEALGKWAEKRRGFDLLLTDFLMPGGLNGAQLAEQLLRESGSLKVVVMSGYAALPDGAAIPWPQNTVRLAKPAEVKTLLETVRRCLDSRRQAAGGIGVDCC